MVPHCGSSSHLVYASNCKSSHKILSTKIMLIEGDHPGGIMVPSTENLLVPSQTPVYLAVAPHKKPHTQHTCQFLQLLSKAKNRTFQEKKRKQYGVSLNYDGSYLMLIFKSEQRYEKLIRNLICTDFILLVISNMSYRMNIFCILYCLCTFLSKFKLV